MIRFAQSSGALARSLSTPLSEQGDRAFQIGGPMILTAEQYWLVATVYDRVAADKMGVPPPQRAAFARKAKRLRMLARIAANIEATAFVKPAQPLKPHQETVSRAWCASNAGWRPKAKYQTLAERLKTARAALPPFRASQSLFRASQSRVSRWSELLPQILHRLACCF